MGSNDKAATRVLVAGGGPAGLLAAQALKKQGFTCKVFEQSAYHGARVRDWSFGVYWAQEPLKDCLSEELIARIIKDGQVDERLMSHDSVMPIYNSSSAELLKAIPIPNQIRLHRLNFIKIISEGIDIEFGKKVEHIEADGKTVTVFFEDGTHEQGDFLIGAEGAHSKVREFLVGKEEAALQKTPLVASFTIAKLPAEAAKMAQGAHPRFYAHTDTTGVVWISCIHDAWADTKPGDWNFIFLCSRLVDDDYNPESCQGPAILKDLKERAEKMGDPFKTIWTSIPEGSKCWHSRLSYWLPKPWDNHNGTVTLIGDALHPMTYHRGQGFNNAVLDVASLAREVAEKGLLKQDGQRSGIDSYEEEAQQRGREAVTASLENSLALHRWETLIKSHLFVSGAVQKIPVKASA